MQHITREMWEDVDPHTLKTEEFTADYLRLMKALEDSKTAEDFQDVGRYISMLMSGYFSILFLWGNMTEENLDEGLSVFANDVKRNVYFAVHAGPASRAN